MKTKERQYLIVIEKSKNGFGAFSPDIPGCVAVGDTRREVKELIREAIQFHLEGLKEDGLELPRPSSKAEYLSIAVA
jgi:predicted RNase H-like HicB family nuclease